MNRREFFEKVIKCANQNPEELQKIGWAYWLAKETHRNQKRDGGERYFEHCRRTAIILMEHGKTNAQEIMMALLHDCVEDGYVPRDIIEKLFGKEIAEGVGLLSKCETTIDKFGFVKKNHGRRSR